MTVRILHVAARPLLAALGLAVGNAVGAACDDNLPSRTPTSRYLLKSGEVYDKKTDLSWERCSVGQRWSDDGGCIGLVKQITWSEAMQQGGTGWRLPTRDELSTLIASNCKRPAINEEAFPDTDPRALWYWTSTESGDYSAWLADFSDGHLTSYERTDVGAVRLVRSGP